MGLFDSIKGGNASDRDKMRPSPVREFLGHELYAIDCRGANLYVHENAVVIDKTGGGLWNIGDNNFKVIPFKSIVAVQAKLKSTLLSGYIEFETIRRGIPFFVEKPIALDIELAKNILNKIEQKGLITAVGFQCRYDNINDAARSYIEKNRIIQVQGSRIGGIPTVPWWRIKSLSGGMLVEATIHQMDLLRYFLGEPDTVYSIATNGFIPE